MHLKNLIMLIGFSSLTCEPSTKEACTSKWRPEHRPLFSQFGWDERAQVYGFSRSGSLTNSRTEQSNSTSTILDGSRGNSINYCKKFMRFTSVVPNVSTFCCCIF